MAGGPVCRIRAAERASRTGHTRRRGRLCHGRRCAIAEIDVHHPTAVSGGMRERKCHCQWGWPRLRRCGKLRVLRPCRRRRIDHDCDQQCHRKTDANGACSQKSAIQNVHRHPRWRTPYDRLNTWPILCRRPARPASGFQFCPLNATQPRLPIGRADTYLIDIIDGVIRGAWVFRWPLVC